jgi:hypothetical protein
MLLLHDTYKLHYIYTETAVDFERIYHIWEAWNKAYGGTLNLTISHVSYLKWRPMITTPVMYSNRRDI